MQASAKLLVIYSSRSACWGELPLYEALVQKLRQLGIAGATAQEGLLGYGWERRVRLPGLFGLHADTPMIVTALEEEEKLREAIPHLRLLAPSCPMALLDAEVIPQREVRKK